MINLKFLAVGLIFAAAEGCGRETMTVADKTDGQITKGTEKPVSDSEHKVTGILTDQGVVCQAMRGDDGELYTFEAIPEGLKTGDRISVIKSTTNFRIVSTCDQGKVLHWDSISLLSSDEKIKTTWDYKNL